MQPFTGNIRVRMQCQRKHKHAPSKYITVSFRFNILSPYSSYKYGVPTFIITASSVEAVHLDTVFVRVMKKKENSLFDTRRWLNSLYDTRKFSVPHVTPRPTFMPQLTLPSNLPTNGFNSHLESQFCPLGIGISMSCLYWNGRRVYLKMSAPLSFLFQSTFHSGSLEHEWNIHSIVLAS